MEELERKNQKLLDDIEVITQEMEFALKEKEDEAEHFKAKWREGQDREDKMKKRMHADLETIR